MTAIRRPVSLTVAWVLAWTVATAAIDGDFGVLSLASAFVFTRGTLSATTQPRTLRRITPPTDFAPSFFALFASEPASTQDRVALEQNDPAENNNKINHEGIVGETKNNSNGDFSFFDEAIVYVKAGSGGQGSSTYKKAKKGANGIPDGGSGGDGGNVVVSLDKGLNTLAGLSLKTLRPNAFGGGGAAASSKRKKPQIRNNPKKSKKPNERNGTPTETNESNQNDTNNDVAAREPLLNFRASDGKPGGRMYDNGRGGEACEVLVPPGTVVQREVVLTQHTDNDYASSEQRQWVDVGTISDDTPQLIVARGGRGGEGTATLKGKKKGAKRRGPEGGAKGRLKLTLKIVADIALVGVPNAGKSTFLASVTRAKPRIADYPFTTVVPNLGTWIPEAQAPDRRSARDSPQGASTNSNALVLCDVPGLIAGASEGVGLGHAFLRHIERCRVILHLVDATSEDPVGDLAMVNDELKRYGSGNLSQKPQVVVLNKIDSFDTAASSREPSQEPEEDKEKDEPHSVEQTKKNDLEAKMKQEMGHTRLLWVSAKQKDGVDDLMTRMASYVSKIKEDEEEERQQPEGERNDAAPVA